MKLILIISALIIAMNFWVLAFPVSNFFRTKTITDEIENETCLITEDDMESFELGKCSREGNEISESDEVLDEITGKSRAKLGQFPYLALLEIYTSSSLFYCTGILIKPKWVLTVIFEFFFVVDETKNQIFKFFRLCIAYSRKTLNQ